MQDIKKCMTFKNAWHHINKRMTSHQICAKQISNRFSRLWCDGKLSGDVFVNVS